MNLNTSQLLENAVRAGASDVFIVAGLPVSMRINGLSDRSTSLPEIAPYPILKIQETMIFHSRFPDCPDSG